MRIRQTFTDRAINALLLAALVVLVGSGTLSLFANEARTGLLFEAHRIAGAAFFLLLIPKAGIIWRSLRRGAERGGSGRTSPSHCSSCSSPSASWRRCSAGRWRVARGRATGGCR